MQKAPNMLTRKAGPLPVYAYALLAVAAWFLFVRTPAPKAGSAATGLPYTPAAFGTSAAQQPSSGGGTAADGLAALLGAENALLVAVQAATPVTAADAAPSGMGAPINNAPVDSFAPSAPSAPTTVVNGVTYAGYPGQGEPIPTNPDTTGMSEADAVAAQQAANQAMQVWNAAQALQGLDPMVADAIRSTGGQPATAPTPYAYVQPAPVDTTSPTVAPPDPRPLPGKPVLA